MKSEKKTILQKIALSLTLVAAVLAGSCSKGSDEIRIAFVTNQIADFWNIAKAGCRDAEKDLGIKVVV